jgi:hypothetical protein
MLQTQYVDRLIGDLRRRLTQSGLWDRAVVVITADHGVSFVAGEPRRDASEANAAQVAWVPLFIKEPHQRTGTTSLNNAQLVDVLPSIADILNVDVPWRLDGQSVFGSPRSLSLPRPFFEEPGSWMRLDGVRRHREVLEHSISELVPRVGDPLREFRIGAHSDLVGRKVASVPRVAVRGSVSAELLDAALWSDVDTSTGTLPAYVIGWLDTDEDASAVALSVNGVVAAVSEQGGTIAQGLFAGVIPPEFVHDGENEIRVYGIDGAGHIFPALMD